MRNVVLFETNIPCISSSSVSAIAESNEAAGCWYAGRMDDEPGADAIGAGRGADSACAGAGMELAGPARCCGC